MKKKFLQTEMGLSTILSITISAVIGVITILTSIYINSWNISESQKLYACADKRKFANDLIELIIKITNNAQNDIGLNLGACYAADGKSVLPFQGDQAWIDNYIQLRADRDLLIAKTAVLGDVTLVEQLKNYLSSLQSFLAYCKLPSGYDNLWKDLELQTCNFNKQIGSSINKCFGIENIQFACQ